MDYFDFQRYFMEGGGRFDKRPLTRTVEDEPLKKLTQY